MTYYNNLVLTSNGYKTTKDIALHDFTYNRAGRHASVTYTCTTKVPSTSFTLISTEVDHVPTLLRNDKKVYTIDLQTFEKRAMKLVDLTEDHWVFVPWIDVDLGSPKHTIDLSKYVDNHHDTTYIYLFNNEILDISNKLDIPFKAVKELLIREAAEYDEHLNKLKWHIYETYNIIENPLEEETSFINFKKYVLKNHIFKMNRYIEIDSSFIGFLVASLTRATLSQNTFNRNNKYQITYNLKLEDKVLLNDLIAFLKNAKVKFEVSADKSTINVFNKPLYRLLTEGFYKDLNFIFRLEPVLLNKFLNLVFLNTQRIELDLNILLQLKQLFLNKRQVVSLKDSPKGGYYAELLAKDDLDSLDGSVIFETNGYYSKVKTLDSIAFASPGYTFVESDDSEVLYLNCLVRS